MSRKKRLSKSIRKYIRLQKARIRRQFADGQERQQQIQALADQFGQKIDEKIRLKKSA